MNNKWKKIAMPFVALAVGFAGMTGIAATGGNGGDEEAVDTRPTVSVEAVSAQDYQVVITSFGEVEALEATSLAAQVSGEVVSWNPNFVPGGMFKRGEVMFSIEKDSYEAALWQAQAELKQAQAALIEEQARADVAKEEAKRLDKAQVTDLYLRKPQLLSAEAALKSAQARLKIAQRDLDNCEVRAPYDALVVSRNLGVGQFVTQGAQVAVLNNIEYAEITIPIAGFDTTFLPEQIAGAAANVVTKGIQSFSRDGIIARDLGVVDPVTRMAQLVVRVQDPYSLQSDLPVMKFGSYAEVNFIGKTLENVFKLPQELVTNQTVWVVDDEHKLEPRTVAVMREEGEFFLIRDGLSNQDQLVTTLPEYPQPGMKVKVDQGADSDTTVSL